VLRAGVRALATAALLISLTHSASLYAAEPTIEQCLKSSEEGQRVRDEGKYRRARELFAVCASSKCPVVVHSECTNALAEVDRIAPSIVIVARNERSEDVPVQQILIDGNPVTSRVAGTPIAIDAGARVVQIEAAGYESAEQRIVASAGEKNRVLSFRLVARATTPPPSTPPLARIEPVAKPVETGGLSTQRAVALTLGGLALAGGATSIFVGLGARDQLHDLQSGCGIEKRCADSDVDSVKRRLLVADITLGAALVSAAAALWLWFTDRPAEVRF
jgi:hypothetical protein